MQIRCGRVRSEDEEEELLQIKLTVRRVLVTATTDGPNHAQDVDREVREGNHRTEAMQTTGSLNATKQIEDLRSPRCMAELQRHARCHQEQEADDDKNVAKAIHGAKTLVDSRLFRQLRLLLELLKTRAVLEVEDHAANEPKQRVNAKKAESPNQQPRHRNERPVEYWIVLPITVIGVRHEFGETGARVGVTLPARCDAVLRRKRRTRITGANYGVGAVTIETRRHGGIA